MTTQMTDSRREVVGWVGLWQIVCQAVLDGAASDAQLNWIDRHVVDLPVLLMWVECREHALQHDPHGDPDDIRELPPADEVKCGDTWRKVVKNGFRRTAAHANGTHRHRVMRHLAAILYRPELLNELETTVYSADELPEAWRQIERDAGVA